MFCQKEKCKPKQKKPKRASSHDANRLREAPCEALFWFLFQVFLWKWTGAHLQPWSNEQWLPTFQFKDPTMHRNFAISSVMKNETKAPVSWVCGAWPKTMFCATGVAHHFFIRKLSKSPEEQHLVNCFLLLLADLCLSMDTKLAKPHLRTVMSSNLSAHRAMSIKYIAKSAHRRDSTAQ